MDAASKVVTDPGKSFFLYSEGISAHIHLYHRRADANVCVRVCLGVCMRACICDYVTSALGATTSTESGQTLPQLWQ